MKATLSNSISRLRGYKPFKGLGVPASLPALSLRGKFSLFVLLATLLTALAVTFVSSNSTREFLYNRLEQKLPSLLQQTAEKIDLSYQQRLHEIGVFADAATLVDGVSNYNAAQSEAARNEIQQFLGYLFNNSPQFESLFVLDNNGALTAWAGRAVNLEPSALSALAGINESFVSSMVDSEEGNIQVASAPISEFGDEVFGTLHAVIDLASLRKPMQHEALSDAGVMYMLDHEGRFIMASNKTSISADITGVYERPVPREPSTPVLHEYENSAGENVLGSSIYLPRIDGALVVEEPQRAVFAPVWEILWRTLTINLAIVLIFSAIAYRVALSITRPIHELSKGVRRISAGDKDVAIPEISTNDEIGILTRAFNAMTSQIRRNTQELERLSSTDELTQLHNYRFFKDALSREAQTPGWESRPLALILCDIDYFKQWNDELGHAKGDEILATVAELLRDTCRDSDLVARYGGDEFAILAPNTSLEGALALAEKIRAAVSAADIAAEFEGGSEKLAISTGVSVFSGSHERLFAEADRALLDAKRSGRNCVRAAGIAG